LSRNRYVTPFNQDPVFASVLRRRAAQPQAPPAHLLPGRGAAPLARRDGGERATVRAPRHLPDRSLYRHALGEVVSFRWERIDLDRGILRVEETKTGEPLELPLTRQLAAVFERRRTEAGDRDEGWVFPSSVSVTGHLKNLHRYHAGISKAAGTRFWFQCARQTGASAAGESPAGKKGKPPLPPRVMGRHS